MANVIDIPKKDHWTYSDYELLPAELRCEIFNGNLIMAPSPLSEHQRVSSNLEFEIQSSIRGRLKAILFHAPMDVVFDSSNVLQPDIIYVSEKKKDIVKHGKPIMGTPDMVVEILSKGSLVYDRVEKKNLYEKFGVEEYWIVDPQNQSVEVYCLENNHYELFSSAEIKGLVASKVIEGFSVEIENIFKEDF
jgi:Uma2 family endonuclease